jgi:ZIP family zinc transporter/zinc and cadmium transporter
MTGPTAGIVFAGVAALANMAGGGFVFLRHEWSTRGLKASLAFGGGFMLGAAILGMIPHSLETVPRGAELILIGYLMLHFLEHVVGDHYHLGDGHHGPHRLVSGTVTAATVFAMMVHTFFDGVAIASAFTVGETLGFAVLVAVILHKVPAGFAVSAVALATGASRAIAFGAAALLGVGTVLGSIALSAAGSFAQYAVPISAGTLIHVAASDLIPEVNEGERWPITLAVVLGGVGFLIVTALMGDHHH